MSFLDALRRALSGDRPDPDPGRIREAWSLDRTSVEAADPSAYDRAQWLRKMKRILDELPDSRPEWSDLAAEARALGLDADWVTRQQSEEFVLLVRRVVSDRVVTDQEHRKLDLARDLIGISDAEAEAVLDRVVAEAQSFFGEAVEGS